MSFLPKDSAVQQQAMLVQTLSLPLTITASATTQNVVVSADNPSLLFINTQGVTGITYANGAYDTAAGSSAVTFVAATDSAGKFNALVRINENLTKVVSATLISRKAALVKNGTIVTAPATGIVSETLSNGSVVTSKIALNFDCGVDFSSTSLDAVIEVKYEAAE